MQHLEIVNQKTEAIQLLKQQRLNLLKNALVSDPEIKAEIKNMESEIQQLDLDILEIKIPVRLSLLDLAVSNHETVKSKRLH